MGIFYQYINFCYFFLSLPGCLYTPRMTSLRTKLHNLEGLMVVRSSQILYILKVCFLPFILFLQMFNISGEGLNKSLFSVKEKNGSIF
ncbi:hypothetical protein DXA95_00575 [Odoribacter sp. OF09-27XD]|nr:hypothetical protein DXA95_00575 [Odoribacter sp. OF09-27XD]